MQEGKGRWKGVVEVRVVEEEEEGVGEAGMRLWVSERRRKRVGIVSWGVGWVVIVGEGVGLVMVVRGLR